jgi:catalase
MSCRGQIAELASQVALGIGVDGPVKRGGERRAMARLNEAWDKYGVIDRPGEPRPSSVTRAPELSLENSPKGSIKSRCVAILAADGVDGAQVARMKEALKGGGARAEVLSKFLGSVKGVDGAEVAVDRTLLTTGSVLYDAVYVPGGAKSVEALSLEGDARHFVNEAFRHGKPIAATAEGVDFLIATEIPGVEDHGREPAAASLSGQGIVAIREPSAQGSAPQQFIEAMGKHRFPLRQLKDQVPA